MLKFIIKEFTSLGKNKIMNKSKVMGFKLPLEIIDEAEKIAVAFGDKNANALGRRLVLETVAKNKNTAGETLSVEAVKNQPNQLAAIENSRKLTLACFGMLFDQTDGAAAYHSLIVPLENEWREIIGTEQEPAAENGESRPTECEVLETAKNTVSELFSDEVFHTESKD